MIYYAPDDSNPFLLSKQEALDMGIRQTFQDVDETNRVARLSANHYLLQMARERLTPEENAALSDRKILRHMDRKYKARCLRKTHR